MPRFGLLPALQDGHPNALMPAWATCSSSCDCTPDTPIAPTHSFSCMIGRPPWIRMPAGKPTKAGRSLTRASKNLLGRLVSAEVGALPNDTSAEIGGVRWSCTTAELQPPPPGRCDLQCRHNQDGSHNGRKGVKLAWRTPVVFVVDVLRHGKFQLYF